MREPVPIHGLMGAPGLLKVGLERKRTVQRTGRTLRNKSYRLPANLACFPLFQTEQIDSIDPNLSTRPAISPGQQTKQRE